MVINGQSEVELWINVTKERRLIDLNSNFERFTNYETTVCYTICPLFQYLICILHLWIFLIYFIIS